VYKADLDLLALALRLLEALGSDKRSSKVSAILMDVARVLA